MKKVLWALLIVVISLTGVSQSEAIKVVAGVSSECDTALSGCIPIPLTNTTLCTTGCIALTNKSFTDANRFCGCMKWQRTYKKRNKN